LGLSRASLHNWLIETIVKERNSMMTISVIVGSTRQGRFSEKPAQWILQQMHKREGIEGQLLDLRDFPMPFFDQPPAMPGRPTECHGSAPLPLSQCTGRLHVGLRSKTLTTTMPQRWS
jgi:hypothetical protein